jgi:hypothetical protein
MEPQAHLRDVLDRIRLDPANRIGQLLPDRWRGLRQVGGAAPDRPRLSPASGIIGAINRWAVA